MKYLLMIYGNDEVWGSYGEEEWKQFVAEHDAVNRELFESGVLIGAYGVADQADAKLVKVADGAVAVTDGPYVETKEYVGSLYIIDVEDLDAALAVAAKIPSSRHGKGVEVRPLQHEA